MRKFRKKVLIVVLLLIVGVVIGVRYRYDTLNKESKHKMAIYVPNSSGSGYELLNSQSIPDGYKLDVEKTNEHCDDGITVSWDDNTKTVSLNATKSGGCDFYLEEENDPLIITSATVYADNSGGIVRTVQLNREVTVSKYILNTNGNTYEPTSLNTRVSISQGTGCFSGNTSYNYTLYIITADNIQSEIFNGSYTTIDGPQQACGGVIIK